jgi:hypothetical protein
MKNEHLHATDEQLLLHSDRESRTVLRDDIQPHLESCSRCRARLKTLEATLDEFAGAHRENWDGELPPASGPHSLLKAQLAELASREPAKRSSRSSWIVLAGQPRAVFAGAAIAACLLLAMWLHQPANSLRPSSASLERWEEPNLQLTPGATVPITPNEVCAEAATKSAAAIPVSLKRKVFELYGVTPPQPDAYEVDYLITPELGGATDIRNLWPEPYQDTVWNAHVKDQLEDRLHQMVCRGDVDLATAQRDLSTDWIAAYRKYFHAERPVADGSSFRFSPFKNLAPRA